MPARGQAVVWGPPQKWSRYNVPSELIASDFLAAFLRRANERGCCLRHQSLRGRGDFGSERAPLPELCLFRKGPWPVGHWPLRRSAATGLVGGPEDRILTRKSCDQRNASPFSGEIRPMRATPLTASGRCPLATFASWLCSPPRLLNSNKDLLYAFQTGATSTIGRNGGFT